MEDLQAEGGGVDFIHAYASSHVAIDDAFIADYCEHGIGRAVGSVDDGDGFRRDEALAAVIDVTENLR